ncbi:oxidoreductase NAD-binding domain-containing protein 1-like isoform X3 [Littorina saxatilis]|uniref:Oxidoreductase NAD-binding domain-containing protein 1 n=1 Tax=Littorina saxatilis TaxID=31220 RepID=A0AAN9BU72_9CAEN
MGRRHLLFRYFNKWSTIMDTKMISTSTTKSSDHMTVTQASSRKEIISPATVVEVKDISNSVKMMSLRIENEDFSFKAGQWVDTFIPGLDTVGGFSMCSSPGLLQTQRILMLAIKFAKHPPAFWVHTKCKSGDTLLLRAGGDFYLDPQAGEENPSDVLLIAGGVGINPLYSMIQHLADLNQSPDGPYRANVLMLYSARTYPELIFKDHLEQLSDSHANITTQFYVSRETLVHGAVKVGRISHADVEKAVQGLRAERLKVYLCGPSPMVHDMEDYCLNCGVSKNQIFYERWW